MKALITGVAGQDGTYLAELLKGKGYSVHGCILSRADEDYVRHGRLLEQVSIEEMDISEGQRLFALVASGQFDEIYNLAGVSNLAYSFQEPGRCFAVNTESVKHILEAIRLKSPQSRFFQASSSELFGGDPPHSPQNETTAFRPRSPYAVSKLAAHWLIVNYRESYHLNCCSGILFNHESSRRTGLFLTKKVCNWAKLYRTDQHEGPLLLGNLEATRDWGHSKDFVEAMWRMLNPEQFMEPSEDSPSLFMDYVIGTGTSTSVKEFIDRVFQKINRTIAWKQSGEKIIEWDRRKFRAPILDGLDEQGRRIVGVAPEYWRPSEPIHLRANISKIGRNLKWVPRKTLDELIDEMINSENN